MTERILRIGADGRIDASDQARAELATFAGRWTFEGEPGGLMILRDEGGTWAGATLRLAGEITTCGGLVDIVTMICLAGWKGTVVVIDETALRTLALEDGAVVGASSTHPSERVSEMLFRLGQVSRDEAGVIERAAAIQDTDPAEIAIAMGFVERADMTRTLLHRAEQIFFGAVTVATGSFRFYEAFDPAARLPAPGPVAQPLLIEHARRMDELRMMAERVPSLKHVPEMVAEAGPPPEELAQVLALCDGKRSIADVGRRASLLDFEIVRSIHELVLSGHVKITGPRPRGAGGIVDVVNEALVEMHRRAGPAADALRDALARFVSGHQFLVWALEGAGPARDGSLSAHRVTANLIARRRADKVARLRKALDEYVSFGLFVIGGHLPTSEARALDRVTSEVLRALDQASHSLAPPSLAPRRSMEFAIDPAILSIPRLPRIANDDGSRGDGG